MAQKKTQEEIDAIEKSYIAVTDLAQPSITIIDALKELVLHASLEYPEDEKLERIYREILIGVGQITKLANDAVEKNGVDVGEKIGVDVKQIFDKYEI